MHALALTPADVVAVWAQAAARFGAEVAVKGTSPLMRRAAMFLEAAGIADGAEFLRSYSTTVGAVVYLPWAPGEVGPGVPCLWAQVDTCVHELEHVRRFKADPVDFLVGYLFPGERAALEADAYAAELEVVWWRGDRDLEGAVNRAVQALGAYALRLDDLDFVREYLLARADVVRAGGGSSTVAAVVLDLLERREAAR